MAFSQPHRGPVILLGGPRAPTVGHVRNPCPQRDNKNHNTVVEMAARGKRSATVIRRGTRPLIVVLAIAVASGCGTSPISTGVLTGRPPACTEAALKQPTIVSVYSGAHLVVTRKFPNAMTTYRFTLPPGSYSVRVAAGVFSIRVRKGRTTRVPEPFCY